MAKKPNYAMPQYTCSDINSVISSLEELRVANERLREWATYWEEKYDESQVDLASVETALEERISALEDERDEYKNAYVKAIMPGQ